LAQIQRNFNISISLDETPTQPETERKNPVAY